MSERRSKLREEEIERRVEPENSSDDDVEKLVRQAIEGNADAFGELYTLFVDKIYRYIFHHVYEKTTAEDITAEVFLKAWRSLSSCEGRENTFSPWLYRIAHNQMVDEIRKKQRRPSVELENAENVISYGRSSEEYANRQELLELIDKLPPNHKQVIILKFIEGLSNSEIAEITGKREGAIRAIQMRALAKLKKELDKE